MHGEKQKDTIIRQCQRLADDENSTNDGFILTLALAGGTGSGLGEYKSLMQSFLLCEDRL